MYIGICRSVEVGVSTVSLSIQLYVYVLKTYTQLIVDETSPISIVDERCPIQSSREGSVKCVVAGSCLPVGGKHFNRGPEAAVELRNL
jgi:hypothetical protein